MQNVMKIVAIVEHREAHRYLYVPVLGTGTGTAVTDGGDPEACAAALVAAALGLPAEDLQVTLHHARLGDTFVAVPPSDVEIRHEDSVWRAAVHVGWLRQWDASWRPLITYTDANGDSWTRPLHLSRMRQPLLGHPATPPVQERRVPRSLPVA